MGPSAPGVNAGRLPKIMLSQQGGIVDVELINRSNGSKLAEQVTAVSTFYGRLRGLMFKPRLPAGHAFHLHPCRSVHTFFMKFPIDVLYLDAEHRIVGIDRHLSPGNIGGHYRGAESVVELAAGMTARTGTIVGQVVSFTTHNPKGEIINGKQAEAIDYR